MRIRLVTPAPARSLNGNRVTAERWARLLRSLKHEVLIETKYSAGASDCMIAVHAYRSADAIAAYSRERPRKPLVVLLAGTDVYAFQKTHPLVVHESMRCADALVGLHDLVSDDIPAEHAGKLTVIHQSAKPIAVKARSRRYVDICVIGHLREEKDPLRAALAARDLPSHSRVRIVHLGEAHGDHWAAVAQAEMASNRRYVWRGKVPHAVVRRCLASSHAMVISSVREGGANVVSEAVVAKLPVLASRIPGNVGLLGLTHPGYFAPGDTKALSALLGRCEQEPGFLQRLSDHAETRRGLFDESCERAAWQALLEKVQSNMQ